MLLILNVASLNYRQLTTERSFNVRLKVNTTELGLQRDLEFQGTGCAFYDQMNSRRWPQNTSGPPWTYPIPWRLAQNLGAFVTRAYAVKTALARRIEH